MATKDPFANLPPIEPEDRIEQGEPVAPDHVEASGDVTTGSPPRTLLKNAGKWAVPAMVVAIGAWLAMPDDQNASRQATTASVEVDSARQADETVAMVNKMKEEAAKKPVPAVPVMPGSQPAPAVAQAPGTSAATAQPGSQSTSSGGSTPATGRPPLPPGYGQSAGAGAPMPTPVGQYDREAAEKAEKALAAHQARQDEIRASAIEVSKVKLLGQPKTGATSQPEALTGLQGEIADGRSDAARAQRAMEERILASMAPPKEPSKSKGANDEFLATNAAASNNAAQLTRQMTPQATTVVNEGHIIRAVLLTRVNSDLPGRVLARVTSDVYDSRQRHIVIPKGSQLIGVYSSQVVVGQERLLMAMNRLILPNGSWISLSGAGAADMTGMSGVKADVNNHFLKMFGSSLVLGASTLLLPRQDTTVGTLQGLSGGAGGTTGSIFATSLNDVLKTLLERNRQIQPTLSLQEGEEFIFMVAHDMAMVPYQP